MIKKGKIGQPLFYINRKRGVWMKDKQMRKNLWNREKWYWCAAVVLGIVFSILLGAHWTRGYSQMIQDGISAKVVRFHVVANSDSVEDQGLKLLVRDHVLEEYGHLLASCESKEETLTALKEAREKIAEAASLAVREAGYDSIISVSVVRESFPFKQYDDLIFPAGVYDALRIEIGDGQGQNWWCVLYPQMCYVDAAWGYTTDESYSRLQNTLTEEEFLIVSALEQEELTPKFKMKIVEWWQERE